MMRADRYCDDATCSTLFSVLLRMSQMFDQFGTNAAVSRQACQEDSRQMRREKVT